MSTKPNTKSPRDRTFTFRVDSEQIQRLQEIAAREDRTAAGELRKLIRERVDADDQSGLQPAA